MQSEPLPLSDIVQPFRGIILDIFGVLHDGVAPFEPVCQTLAKLRGGGIRVCLLSNSPRRAALVIARLSEMGLGRDLYDGVVSSGELVYAALSGASPIAGMPDSMHYVHAGPRELSGLLDGLGHRQVSRLSDAGFILATGEIEGNGFSLEKAQQLGLLMVCANPDAEVIIAGRRILCAGALAARYEAIGGHVLRVGKPEVQAYIAALKVLDLSREQVLAIGDNLATDIAGARHAGIASALVLSGVHARELEADCASDRDALAPLCRRYGAVPDFVLKQFSWS